MNKKGLTLIELIAVIAILVIILLISFPIVIESIKSNRNKLYIEQENKLVEVSEEYLSDNYNENTGSEIIITKDQLINGGYIEEIYDLKNTESICNGYVSVTNYNTTPIYKAYISCEGYVTTGYDSNKI